MVVNISGAPKGEEGEKGRGRKEEGEKSLLPFRDDRRSALNKVSVGLRACFSRISCGELCHFNETFLGRKRGISGPLANFPQNTFRFASVVLPELHAFRF